MVEVLSYEAARAVEPVSGPGMLPCGGSRLAADQLFRAGRPITLDSLGGTDRPSRRSRRCRNSGHSGGAFVLSGPVIGAHGLYRYMAWVLKGRRLLGVAALD